MLFTTKKNKIDFLFLHFVLAASNRVNERIRPHLCGDHRVQLFYFYDHAG